MIKVKTSDLYKISAANSFHKDSTYENFVGGLDLLEKMLANGTNYIDKKTRIIVVKYYKLLDNIFKNNLNIKRKVKFENVDIYKRFINIGEIIYDFNIEI